MVARCAAEMVSIPRPHFETRLVSWPICWLLAMLRHTQAVAGSARPLRLEASPALLQAAGEEAALHGHPLEDYLRLLDAERAERAAASAPAPDGLH